MDTAIVPKATPKDPGGFVPTPSHPSRAVAGLLLAAHRHRDFEKLGSGLLRVPSASTSGLKYTVDPFFKDGRCSCPAWRYGHAGNPGEYFVDKHSVAAEFVLRFWEARPGISYEVVEMWDAGLHRRVHGIFQTARNGREAVRLGFSLTLERALFEVVDRMQDDVARAAEAVADRRAG